MAITPVVSKARLDDTNPTQLVYSCPPTATYAIVDVTITKEDTSLDVTLRAAISTDTNASNLTSIDYFSDKIDINGSVTLAEINRLIIGPNQNLFISVVSASSPNYAVNVRVNGIQDTVLNKIVAAGRLAASTYAPNSINALFDAASYTNVSYVTGALSIGNNSTNQALIEVWISDSTNTSNIPPQDKVLHTVIPSQDTVILESIMTSNTEKIYVRSSVANVEYFLNGMVMRS